MSIRIEDLVFDGGSNTVSINDLVFDEAQQTSLQEKFKVQQLRQIPEAINLGGGLPIGGEPMVSGPDILAKEQGQTKTFMEDEEGKPVEVRRAQAIDIGGRIIEEPISPDGMSLDFRGNLIKEKTKELQSTSGLPYSEYIQKSNALRSELSKLQKDQQAHEANQLSFLSKLITRKPGVSVELETGLGEERVTGAEGKITSIPIETRASAAIKQIGDQREFIDNIIVNDKFLDYAKTKGIDTPGLISRMAGQYLNVGEAPDRLEELKKNPQIRKLAEEWAMTSPEFMDVATDIFKRAWDGYAGAIGSGTVGPIGLLLKGVGLEQTGQSFIDAAEYADQQRQRGQDPRKVGALAQFGRDVSSGLGFTGAAIVTGALGNTARASLGLNSARAIDLFQKANTLTFSGLNSAWQGYSEAKSDGATDEQAKQAALFTGLTQAPLELVSPLQKWVGRFDPAQQSRIYKGLNKAAQAVIEGTEEALFNEMPQEIAGNLVKKFVYDPNQDIFEGVPYAGGVGGASGILSSIFTQMIAGKRAKKQAQQGDQEGSEETDIDSKADEMAASFDTDPAQELAQQMMSVSTDINNLKEEIANDEMGLQAIEKTAPAYQAAELALNEKKANLAALQTQFDKLSAGPAEVKTEAPAAALATPPATKEAVIAKIDELNKEFDALDENDQAGIDRVNKQIFAEQNKIAGLTAIEQGVEPQGTTPTREMGLPPSGRRSPFGTFYPDRPVLQAFVKATDKVLAGIKVTGKRAQKLKNAIRTGIANNAGFLAGTNTEVISSEEYGKLTGGKQVAADTGTYRATFFNGKKYLVVPDVNQLAGISIQGEQRAASRDAALDQESRAAAKKIEEEVIHLSMYQGIQDEYKALKNPKLSEEQYIVKRISEIAKEVKRTNPNALPGVSNAYLNDKSKLLDDMTFSQEFMRMVIQRVRTGQITEDLNAIRKAEQEAFSDQDKGIIIAWKNSILNALQFLRNSIARYLGKGTSTKEVKRMEDAINNILDEYGIVKGEANYEFKDYSKAEPKGELKAEPTEVTPTVKETVPVEPVLSETITPTEETSPNTEVESEVVDIENLADDATYEQIEEAAPATMVNLKSSIKNVAGSFQQFSNILNDSFKSLVRFAQTIWKKIGKLTIVATGISAIASTPFVIEYQNLQGPKGRADLRPTGLIKNNANFFKPYLKKTTVEKLEKSLETPAETLDLIRNAINQAQPFVGNVDIDFNSIDQFADSIKPEDFPSGNTKRSYNYNPLLEISADDIKNAAQSLKALAKDKAKIESRIRQIMGAMEFFTKRKFKDVKIIIRQTSPSEAATFMALGRAGGFPTSRAQYNPKENTIEIQPQTLISLAEDGIVATSSASNIANELTHNLQFTTNNGQPLGILGIKLSDFDTASTFLVMQMPVYSKNGKLFQTINAESNWADILVSKYFGAKNNIQPKSIESIIAEQPKIQKALQEKETTDFVNSIFDLTGVSSQEIIARAGTTPAIEARAGVTPQMDAEHLAAVERGDMETAQRMVEEAYKNFYNPENYVKKSKSEQYVRKILAKINIIRAADNSREMDAAIRISKELGLTEPDFDRMGSFKLLPVTYDDAGNVIPLSQRFDVTSPIIARAGVTPEGEPISKRGQSIMQKITTRMISDLEAQAEMLKPKDSKAYTEYKSRTTQKGKTYNQALISPFSLAANLFTSNSFTEANNALNKIVRGNPDADFFDIAQVLASPDAELAQKSYNLKPQERFVLMDMIYTLLPAFRKEVSNSNMSATAIESFRLESLNVEARLARNMVLAAQQGGQILSYARVLRKIVGAGMAIDTYKRGIIDSMGSLANATKASFNEVANVIRGDRRKSMDKVFNTKEVFRKAVSMLKMAQKNPEKVRQAIRAEVSKKQTDDTKKILLDFAAGLFDTKEDKYANMVVDQTVQNILSIGMNKKEFTIDNVSKFMYQSFATAAKQMGIQQIGIEKQKKGKRSGKYLEMVKAVIGNDNAYKSFLNDLENRMAEKYQSREAFNADYAELFKALRSNEWADKLRTQAIKDSAEFLNYKFTDLFTYLGSQRNVNQEAVKQHIRAELQGTGASNELIEKFIQDTDKYLNEETSRILQDKLGFRIDEKTGKVIPKPLLSQKIQEEAEAQFKAIKNLKDITKLSMTDEGNFKTGLISRIITEVGMDREQATELAALISAQMEKAILAQRSENVDAAIKKAQEVLLNNKIKPKTNQRTILQKLIEMANMGVLDSEMVYEAFRQTHDFPKNFMPYDAEFTNTLREWGDRISKLPAGVIRSIEEEKMGRALMNKSKFTTGDVLSSYWYFALISQASTTAINALSGASNLISNVAVWSMYNPKSFFPMMRALYSAVSGKQSPAVNSFLYVMRNGLNPSGMQDEKRAKYPKTNVLEGATPENTPKIVYYLTNFGDGKINFLPDWMNTALKNVNPRQLMRLLRATDMFLREVAYEAKAAQLGAAAYTRQGFDMAKRQAEMEMASSQATGKEKQQEIIIRANEIYREQRLADEEQRAIAEQASLETAFNQEPQGLFGMLANFVNGLLVKYPATKFVIPFTNVVANVTNEFLNYTFPVAMWRVYQSKRNGLKDPFTQGRADKEHEIAIKGGIGFAAMVVPFIIQALTSGDDEDQEKRPYIQFYAEGPKDPRQKKIWQQRGGQKYSVRVGDTYLSYLYTPLVIPLAMGAMLQEEVKTMKKKGEKVQVEDVGKLAGSIITAPFSIGFVAVLNQSFLTGLADLLEFKESQNPVEKGTQFVGGIISRMMVPGAFRDINKLYTEEKAVGGDYLSNFLKEMPGSINFLNKDVGYFGDPVQFPSAVREEGFGKRLASLFGRIVSTEQPDPAWEIMYRNNLTPPAWDASLSWDNGFRMTKKEELEFIRTAGPRMRDAIIENADELDELPLSDAQDLLSNIVASERRGAKDDLQDSLNIPLDIE